MSALSILTVEDNPLTRADLRLILEDNGFEVCAAARNGAEAVALARVHAPDLILIDLNLPELDGVEATRRILRERSVPIVALTGYANTGAVDRAVEAGAVGYVTKPFSERRLVEVVRAALGGRLDSAPEVGHYGMRILIERLVRDGRTEREINAALRRATGVAEPRGGSRLARFGAYLRRR